MNPISIKLNDENFSTWKAEALAALRQSKLEKFIRGVDFGGRPRKHSQEYKIWEEQDQVVFKWLLASICPMLLIRRAACRHAFEIWNQIERHFATEEDCEEQLKRNKILEEENTKMAERIKSLNEKCEKIKNDNKALKVRLAQKRGEESKADTSKKKPGSG